jgi:CheY-like chemotaxis protein
MGTPIKMVKKKRERVLIAEDDAASRELMVDVLRDAGYTVDAAADGYEALWMAAQRMPDVLLTDLGMPGMDGIELARRLHVFARSVPVILTTGLEETRDVVTAAAAYGAVACLKKPMSLDEVLWTIDRAIAIATARGDAAAPPV